MAGTSKITDHSINTVGSYLLDDDSNQSDTDSDEMKNFARQPRCNASTYGSCECGMRFTPSMEDKLRRRLRFFFMNPCEKWRARRQFPWKLVMQVFKIFIVTVQLTVFGFDRAGHVNFVEHNTVSFKHLYLKNWDPTFETMPYPPTNGAFAVYTMEELEKSIDFVMQRYNETKTLAIGSYDFPWKNGSMPPLDFCIRHYHVGQIWAHNQSYMFDARIDTDCYKVYPLDSIRTFLHGHNITLNMDSIVKINITFALKSVHLKYLSEVSSPDCFEFLIKILYDNSEHSGQCVVSLKDEVIPLKCSSSGKVIHEGNDYSKRVGITALDVIVILVSLSSLILCLRSIVRAEQLKRWTVKYYKFRHNKELTFYDTSEFLNLWHVLIVINDTLTIIGSAIKVQIESKGAQNYEVCGLMLGTGNLLVWIGVLRYFSFFEHYNILVLTMKRSLPDITRFLMCAAVLYLGFTFCGWVVLGPYHLKFREIGTASECLFSLVNGDDMFVTFAAITPSQSYIYYYSRAYLYIFISLFMYVVYSVFTSIIINTYDTIKGYYRDGFPKSILHQFVEEHTDDVSSPLFRSESSDQQGCGCRCCYIPCLSFCCKRDNFPDEYTPIIRT